MIISGGHGTYNDIDGTLMSVGGKYCFMDYRKIVYKFYFNMCMRVGVAAEPDPCVYDDANKVVARSADVPLPKPEPMPLHDWPQSDTSPTPLMLDERFNKIKFNVINIAQLFNNADALVLYLQEYDPTFLIIDWCFASNCDLALALRARGF